MKYVGESDKWLFIVTSPPRESSRPGAVPMSADMVFEERWRQGIHGFRRDNAPGMKEVQAGDDVVFYVGGRPMHHLRGTGKLLTPVLPGFPEDGAIQGMIDPVNHVRFAPVKLFARGGVNIVELVPHLELFANISRYAHWGVVMQRSLVRLSGLDWDTIVSVGTAR